MEKLVDLGLVKSIGVSNFNSQQIERLLANCRIKPVANQVQIVVYRCRERERERDIANNNLALQ